MAQAQQIQTEQESQTSAFSTVSTPVPASLPVTHPRPQAENIGEVTAGARQVRPDEVLAALGAIESRRGEGVIASLPLAQILEKLGVDATADEVWQEIYWQRTERRKQSAVEELKKRQKRRRTAGWLIGTGAAVVTAVALRVLLGDVTAPRPAPALGTTQRQQSGASRALIAAPEAGVQRAVPQESVPQARFTPQNPVAVRSGEGLVSLAQFPTNQPVVLDFAEIQQLSRSFDAHGRLISPEQLRLATVDLSRTRHGGWQVERQQDAFYLLGWVEAPRSATATQMMALPVTLYNRPDYPGAVTGTARRIRIPLDNVAHLSRSTDGPLEQLQGRLLHLDGRALEGL